MVVRLFSKGIMAMMRTIVNITGGNIMHGICVKTLFLGSER